MLVNQAFLQYLTTPWQSPFELWVQVQVQVRHHIGYEWPGKSDLGRYGIFQLSRESIFTIPKPQLLHGGCHGAAPGLQVSW